MAELIDVRLPHMGVVERAVLTAWHKSPGDLVSEGEPLCDVSTDKVDTEVASPATGRLVRFIAHENDEIPVGAVIAQFADTADPADLADLAPLAAGEAASLQAGDAETETAGADVIATQGGGPPGTPAGPSDGGHQPLISTAAHRAASSPLARRLAKQAGVDLGDITGTGLGGRIRRADVEAAIARQAGNRPVSPAESPASAALSSAPAAAAAPTGAPAPAAVPAPAAAPVRQPVPAGAPPSPLFGVALPAAYQDVPREEVPLSPQRRMIAENMVRSVSTAAQATAQADVDMSAVANIRAEVNGERAAQDRPKLSVLAFIARATVATLVEHRDLNATFTDTHLVRWRTVNLGIAVDAPHGLLVPVVRSAERLTAAALAEEIADLAERTRSRRLRTEDLQAPTFTISNSGSIGGVTSTPLLNHPNVGTLGVPALIRQPVAVTAPNGDEYVAIRPVMRLGLTFDHRAMDGSAALRFLLDLQHRLETWPRFAYL